LFNGRPSSNMRPGKYMLSLGPAPHDRARAGASPCPPPHATRQPGDRDPIDPRAPVNYSTGQCGTGTALPRGPTARAGRDCVRSRVPWPRKRSRTARRLQRPPLAVTDANRCRGRGPCAARRPRARARAWDTRSPRALASHEPDRLPGVAFHSHSGKSVLAFWN